MHRSCRGNLYCFLSGGPVDAAAKQAVLHPKLLVPLDSQQNRVSSSIRTVYQIETLASNDSIDSSRKILLLYLDEEEETPSTALFPLRRKRR
ncbi:hypothetical protein chiPu_0023706 [Chiloscyllium punctatum]|uniref:Uncharacterized protein n=1 Tax=Chiloscyllium punctatum TaxID=137246 RepID=A0A401TAH7_CHIPU|nr:hypothetical protein [Chiloscyllium punctatum]